MDFSAYVWISVQFAQDYADSLAIFDEVSAIADDLIAFGSQGECWRSRIQSQSLPQARLDIRKLGHVIDCHGSFADHGVNFLLQRPVCLWVLEEQVEEKRKESGGGFVTCNDFPVSAPGLHGRSPDNSAHSISVGAMTTINNMPDSRGISSIGKRLHA